MSGAVDQAGLAQVQELVLELLEELDRVCRAHGLRYHLAYGTLLGAVREQRIIPWDVDADVWVAGEELPRLVEVLGAELGPAYELLTPQTHDDYEYLFPRLVRRGVHHVYLRVDLFPLDPAPRARWARWLYIRVAHLLGRMWFVRRADTSVRRHYSTRKRGVARLLGAVSRLVPERLLLAAFQRWRRLGSASSGLLVSSCGCYKDREYVDRESFLRPGTARLGHRELPAPEPAADVLRGIYGRWEVPVSEDRQRAELVAATRDFVTPLREQGVIA